MPDLQTKVLNQLAEGRWAFSCLLPSFKRSLSQNVLNLQQWPSSLGVLSLLYYGHSNNLADVNGLQSGFFFNDLNGPAARVFMAFLPKVLGPGAKLSSFTAEEETAVRKALQNVGELWPEARPELKLIQHLVRASNEPVLGASHPHAFGIVFYGDLLTTIRAEELELSLVHELGHQELFLINLIDRLVSPGFDRNQVFAPMQGRPRPPIGRLHAFYAMVKMIQLKAVTGRERKADLELLAATRETFSEGELTPFGSKLVETLYNVAKTS